MSEFQQIIADVLASSPEWLRRDLISADPAVRQRAEEALAARIAAALTSTAAA